MLIPLRRPYEPGFAEGFSGHAQFAAEDVGAAFTALHEDDPQNNPYPILPSPGGHLRRAARLWLSPVRAVAGPPTNRAAYRVVTGGMPTACSSDLYRSREKAVTRGRLPNRTQARLAVTHEMYIVKCEICTQETELLTG
ncbi:hypothetical protein [Streptomyces sp. NPDC088246]|uniref:hypothetical protein n=1 Tax=Streptomyces sp. NPDC088246 TaxID=3365842 RepID=UPI0037FEE8DE